MTNELEPTFTVHVTLDGDDWPPTQTENAKAALETALAGMVTGQADPRVHDRGVGVTEEKLSLLHHVGKIRAAHLVTHTRRQRWA
jgi:hypothetical protein